MTWGIFQKRVGAPLGGEEVRRGGELIEPVGEEAFLLVRREDGGHAVVDGGDEGVGPGREHGEAGAKIG